MVLADTSVWIDHLYEEIPLLRNMLNEDEVYIHPFVIGELACGNVRNRAETFRLLGELPVAAIATDKEVFDLIETQMLYGRGITWGDAHIIASAFISGCPLWTRDKRLLVLAQSIGIAQSPNENPRST